MRKRSRYNGRRKSVEQERFPVRDVRSVLVLEPSFQQIAGTSEPAGNCTNGPAELHCRLSESLAFQITENNRCTILSRQAIHFFVEDAANVFRDRVSLVRGR